MQHERSRIVEVRPPSPIRTERSILRCYTPDDAPSLKDAIDSSLDHLQAWMPWAMKEPSTLDVLVARLERFQDDFMDGIDHNFGIFGPDDLTLLGGIGLHREKEPDALSIGYWLRVDCTGSGLATEAAAAITRAARDITGIERLVIYCDPANTRSAAVAQRLGYTHVRTLPSHSSTPLGEPRDSMVWVLRLHQEGDRRQRGNSRDSAI